MGIAIGDPINRVNLLYIIEVDRIHRIDRTHIAGSIKSVNPVYINKVEQIHAVDGIADGDSNQPRSALKVRAWPRSGSSGDDSSGFA